MGFLSSPKRQKLTAAETKLRQRADSLAGQRGGMFGSENRFIADVMDNSDDKRELLGRGGADVSQALGAQGTEFQSGRADANATNSALKRGKALSRVGMMSGELDLNQAKQFGALGNHGRALQGLGLSGLQAQAGSAGGAQAAKAQAKAGLNSVYSNMLGSAIGGGGSWLGTKNPDTGVTGWGSMKAKLGMGV